MKRVHVLAGLAVVMLSAPSAWAQFGLYGAPELLRLPPVHHSSAGQASRFDQEPIPLPSAPPGPVAYSQPRNTRAAFVPDDPGYTQQVMRPVNELPATPEPTIPSLSNTYVGRAPVDSARNLPVRQARAEQPQPEIIPQPRERAEGGGEVVSHMLQESGCFEPNPWTDPATGAGCGASECEISDPCLRSPWFGSALGLVMGRDAPNRVWTSYSSADPANQLMHTDFGLDWEAGGEITFGRRFCCDTWSIGATYWTLNAFSGFTSQLPAGGISTPFDFTDVIYANPALAGILPVTLFDFAQEHRLWRTNEIHNIEINLVRHHIDLCMCDGSAINPLGVDWMIGARFFRFEENLTFGSLEAGGYSWTADPDRQGYLEDMVTNNLVGVQIGCDVDYNVWRNFQLFVRPKFGIYNNHVRNSFRAYRGDGELFAPDPAPPAGSPVPGSYPVNATENVVSFMTEVNAGLDWQFLPNWTFTAGYRVLVATGIGLADNQFPPYIVDIPELANIDTNGQLVLHGVFSGIEFNY